MVNLSGQANYGNWVPANMMRALWGTTATLGVATAVAAARKRPFATLGLAALTLPCLAMSTYMQLCRKAFAFGSSYDVMAKVHQNLVDHLPWDQTRQAAGVTDGSGTILDIGCGAGALTNRCALTFPNAKLIGIDYWGAEWSYAQEQCEQNARIEGVSDRVSFEKGDAAQLAFADECFDAAVSNFVFHEVRSVKDKRDVVREALRVVRRGGAFAFQDKFGQEALYGNMKVFISDLLSDGTVREIHYVENIEDTGLVPAFAKAPWMIKDAGLIWGIR